MNATQSFESWIALPCIDEYLVREAVNALQTMKPLSTSLMNIRLVDEIVADPTFPCGEDCRQYALNLLLVTTIAREYAAQRQVCGGLTPAQTETRAEALRSIASDSQRDNTALLAWGWLYYRFVRVDLEIDAQTFSTAAGIHERTLRRYQRKAITYLTAQLRQNEQWIRQQSAESEVQHSDGREISIRDQDAVSAHTGIRAVLDAIRSLFRSDPRFSP